MGYISSGEAIGSRRTPIVFAGRLGDLVNTPNVRNVKREMPTKTIKYGYAFSNAASNAAVQKLLKRIFNETSIPANDCCTDATDNDRAAKNHNCCIT